MTLTNPLAAWPDNGPWLNNPFAFTLGDTFQSYVEAMLYAHSDETFNEDDGVTPVPPAEVVAILKDIGAENSDKMTPLYYSRRKIRDTSLGGNPAINPLHQYNETDDPPATFTISREDGSTGMGRVYSSQIDDFQPVLYLQFGSPIFNTVAAFYSGAVNPDQAEINRSIFYSGSYKLGRLMSGISSTIASIPVIALESLYRFATYKSAPITSYYDFRNEQLLYYRYVNTILVILSANLGWMESTTTDRDDGNAKDQQQQEQNLRRDEKTDMAENSGNALPGSPDYISELQMDIGRILYKRFKFLYGSANVKVKSTDDHINDLIAEAGITKQNQDQQASTSSGSTTDNSTTANTDSKNVLWTKLVIDGIRGGSDLGTYLMAQYVGFRLESTVSTSESIDNNTDRPSIADAVNGRLSSVRDKLFSAMDGKIGSIPVIGDVIGSAVDGITGFISGSLSHTGLGGLSQLATGSALIDIPHVWKDSTFSNSYTFSVHLKAAGGDDLSILQDVYVPFAMLLAGGSPRAQGPASYTAPFLVKAYSKGTVSIPMGMITHMTITRGASQHGWSRKMLPTEIKVDFTISDMTPSMFVSMGSSGSKQTLRDTILGTNNNFMNYLEMLSGLDIHSKLSWQSANKRINRMLQMLLHNKLNPVLAGMRVGSLPIMRVLNQVVPASWSKPS